MLSWQRKNKNTHNPVFYSKVELQKWCTCHKVNRLLFDVLLTHPDKLNHPSATLIFPHFTALSHTIKANYLLCERYVYIGKLLSFNSPNRSPQILDLVSWRAHWTTSCCMTAGTGEPADQSFHKEVLLFLEVLMAVGEAVGAVAFFMTNLEEDLPIRDTIMGRKSRLGLSVLLRNEDIFTSKLVVACA